MTQADDKKSLPFTLLPGDSPVPVSGLPDAQSVEAIATGEVIPFPIVGVGASAGGIEALQRLFKVLPGGNDIAYIVVVHLAAEYPSHLADILGRITSMPVTQVMNNVSVQPNSVYVIPPGHYLVFDRGYLHLEPIPEPRAQRKAIDVLFISLAEEQGERSIGIVLTGADHDGTVGLKAIKAAGGMVMAQAPETAEHPGMPQSAIQTGLVDHVVPIEEMAGILAQYIECSSLWYGAPPPPPGEEDAKALKDIMKLMRNRGGADFRGYKEGMLIRRIKRRMSLKVCDSLASYLGQLQAQQEEVQALRRDLLINVTEFFREPQAWRALEESVLPRILDNHQPGEPVRAWVAGCSTGEEAYSLGIALLEMRKKAGLDIDLHIIASDLDQGSLEVARAGVYPDSIANVLNPELLTRYFTRTEGEQFRVRKALRDSILFSHHNLLADPPFSRMDLVSCRNLLIYLKPEVQDQLFRMFHFALKPGGYLFLGKSETVGSHYDLFTPISKKFRLYQSKETPKRMPVRLPLIPGAPSTHQIAALAGAQPKRTQYSELVRELLLKQRLATAVLIDQESQVLYFYGPTRDFIAQPEGAATQELLSMVSDRLRVAIRAVIHTARQEGKTGEVILECPPDEHRQLRVRAMRADKQEGGLILVTFEYEPLSVNVKDAAFDPESWAKRQLQDDLRTTQLDLEASIEALEANNVELHLANEEMMSMNEELQSANEELETSKEELQSVNEELATVNSDLERTIQELRTSNDDLLNLLASNDLPTLFLDRELCIKRFTPASRKLFRLVPSDVGRPISDFALRVEPQDLEKAAAQAQIAGSAIETEVSTPDGHFYLQRVLPYRTEDRIDGTVITFVPIDALKEAEQEIRESEKRFRALADSAPVFIWTSGLGGRLEFVNRRFTDETGRTVESLLGDSWHNLVHPSDLAGYLAACAKAEAAGEAYDVELRLRNANGMYNWMRFVGEPRFEQEKLAGFVGTAVDIQYHKDVEQQLRDVDRRKDEFLAVLGHELRNPLSPIRAAAEALRFVKSDDERLSWAREIITRQVDHITRLVDDLLDIARLSRGFLTLNKETVDVALIVHHTLESIKELIESRQHHLSVSIRDEPLIIIGDHVRLTQILENLLGNAAKFTEEGGQLALDVHRDGKEVVITVSDNGIGIPRHMLPKIFEIFVQEERAERKSGSGLGIGLSLVSQLVSLHGGTITASSEGPGEGSKFAIRLPLVDVPASPAQVAISESTSPGKARTLVVDDNADSADATSMLLAMYGYEVRTAYDFTTAVREAASFVPQVALLDLSKPEPDGLRLARQLQQMPETKNTLLIALSGYGQPDDLERSKEAGFAHHLVKPVNPDTIHKLIQSALASG